MKLRQLTTVLTLVVAALVAQPAMGQTVNEFTGNGGNDYWNNGGNWDRRHKPNNTERAYIPTGMSCTLHNGQNPGVADSIDVDGTLTVQFNQTLTIDADSQIMGAVFLENDEADPPGAQLLITADLTISGPGGKIDMMPFTKIDEAAGSLHNLTIDNNCNGPLAVECGMTIIGSGEINCGLINDGFVISDNRCVRTAPACALSLNDGPKSGAGEWQSQNDDGWLQVNVGVSGPGTWRIKKLDDNGTSVIEINACCNLSGDVILKSGVLRVNQSFCTTGDLTLASVINGVGDTEPKIKVAADTTATFGYAGLACPSCP